MTDKENLTDELVAVAKVLWQRLYNDPPLEWPGLTHPDAAFVVEDARAALEASGIEALKADNAVLREALERIVDARWRCKDGDYLAGHSPHSPIG